MNVLANNIFGFMLGLFWIAGVVIAKGFVSTTIAIFLPFYSWYLVIEKTMLMNGLI